MPSYLLPCQCGKEHRVESVQAGEKITCTCGQTLTVPTLRGLNALAVAPEDKAGQSTRSTRRVIAPRSWSPLHGAAFSLGLFAALIAAVVIAISLVQYAQIAGYTTDFTPQVHEFDAAQIDQLSPADSLDVFQELVKEGLGTPEPPIWVQAKERVQALWQRMIWSGIALALGLTVAAGAVIARPQPGGPKIKAA